MKNMIHLFSAFKKRENFGLQKQYPFSGIKPQSNNASLRQIQLARRFVIPLKQHIGTEGELCVKPGDHVLRGQPLTFSHGYILPIHAPTSGTIIEITPHIVAHSFSLSEMSIIIVADGEDRWIERKGWNDYHLRSYEELINRIHQFGVVGLGSAGFPTGIKSYNGNNKVRTLIINATECEPYITADDRLIQDCAIQIVEGIRILAHILQPHKVLIGIEDNKAKAISILHTVLAGSHDISLRIIPSKRSSGSAKQLTQVLTGKKIPHNVRSSDIGILIQNVSTAFAVKRAVIDGEPLTECAVTLTGRSISQPGNVWARLGSPVHHLLEQAGFFPEKNQIVIMGGPITGFRLSNLEVPVIKTTNCLLAPSTNEINGWKQEERECIRCGTCATVCPADLLPQQLYWYSKSQQHDKATAHNLDDCIECGACSWVCPSNIPLVQYFRQAKAEIYVNSMEEKRAAKAKSRFEARQARLAREKITRFEQHKQRTAQQREKNQNTTNIKLVRFYEEKIISARTIIKTIVDRIRARKGEQQKTGLAEHDNL